MANLSQARFKILPQIFLTGCFLKERIETQNLGKDQFLAALTAVAALLLPSVDIFANFYLKISMKIDKDLTQIT